MAKNLRLLPPDMKQEKGLGKALGWGLLLALACFPQISRASISLTNPILFVTQVQLPKEVNGNVSNTFLSVVSLFGNHLGDTTHAGRGGDLWLMTTNAGLVNLTRKAGLGTTGSQDGIGIGVRDPAVHWSGKKAIFSMVSGSPTNAADPTAFYWQLYEVTNLDSVIANTNTIPAIVLVPNQPANFNNVSPCYGTDGRIIFMTDRPHNGAPFLYPPLEEYKGNPTVTGTWSLDPATGDLRLLNHTPSGAFNPIVDSLGRIIETRWDHLVQDSNATDDRLGRATNGSINFLAESPNAGTSTNIVENFPEPRNFDGAQLAALQVHGNAFNFFFPWMLPETGGAEEVLNHVGRHEMSQSALNSFTNDANLISFTNPAIRGTFGIASANTNYLINFFQIVEDPRNPGKYFGVDAPDFSPGGGTHTAGRIIALTGPPSLNPTGMVIVNITSTNMGTASNPLLYRNPLPMSDGALLAAATPALNVDTNLGTEAFPRSSYQFRLMLLTNSGGSSLYTTNTFLTTGLTNAVSYWAGSTRIIQTNALWELQPVEVHSRPIPASWQPGIASVEQQVFAEEGVDLPTFQSDMAARNIALVVSRNVTARDAADKQQPYNLQIPGGVSTIGTNSGKVYSINHLQFMQADYLRGYTYGTTNIQPGRRVLATPMHDTAMFNRQSSISNAPAGGTELMLDGSQATFIPANRAVTWQLTGSTNEAVVRERYWVTFRPGEVRTCANCHGINDKDQIGRTSPTNAPLALRQLLRYWRTNSANAYSLTVNNGSGGGQFGAGTILNLTANPAPSGTAFSQWSGTGFSNALSTTTLFVMPGSNTTVSAIYTNLPAPNFVGWQLSNSTNLALSAQAAAGLPWILQSSIDLSSWTTLTTNPAALNGLVNFTVPINPANPRQFFRLQSP